MLFAESITSQWPWWKEFHSFWRELLNYNPICVTTSTPGADHAGQAVAAFHAQADATGMGAHEEYVPVTNNEGAGAGGDDEPQEDEEQDEEMGKEADDEPLSGWEVRYHI